MVSLKSALAACTILTAFSAPAFAAEQPAESAGVATDIVVTARRSEERLQEVPVAVSVVTPAKIEAKGTFNPVDLVQSAPGLTVTASISDRNNLTYTIRGQGYQYGTTFPAVITYYGDVPVAHLTQGSFFDVANVQVLRGPQGVNFGRVTDGGNVLVTPQAPKNEFGGYVTAKVGNYGLRTFNGALNLPLIEDRVLLRVAGETARRDGFTTNVFNGQKLDNVAYEAYRIGLTLKPVEGLENTTMATILNTHDNGTSVIFDRLNPTALGANAGSVAFLFAGGYGIDANGSVLPMAPGLTPFTAADFSASNYVASQQAQLAAQKARGPRAVSLVDPIFSKRKNLYIVNTTTADLTDTIQLKNIFGYIREKEDEGSNYGAGNGAAVLTCHSACPGATNVLFTNAEQYSEELRLAGKALDNRLTWSLGGYMDEQRPHGPSENATINVAVLNRVGVNDITTKSRAVYGSAEYAITDQLRINGGLRYTHDTVHSEQTTYLSPINGGQQALFNALTGPFAAKLGGPYSTTVANAIVAATFAPIPHGQCVTYGAGSILYATGAQPCVVNDGSFDATTWTVGASYKTGAGQLFYAKVSKGYRPGGVNSSAPAGVDPNYQPETDVSVEIGAKADWHLGGMFLRTNIAAYTDRYKSVQKNVVVPGAVPVSMVRNVNNARVKGVELEVTLVPVEGLTFSGTYAYTDAKFDLNVNYAPNSCDPTATTTLGTPAQIAFCPFNKFNSVPKHQWTLSAEYKLPLAASIGEISFGGSLYHQSQVALTDSSGLNPGALEPGYTTLDLSANWRNVMGQPVDLGVFVTNVTDKLYRIGSNDLTQRSSIGTGGSIYAAPRMWGASVKYRFGGDAR